MRIVKEYPRLLLLLASTCLAYGLYMMGALHWLHGTQGASEYMAAFIGGLLITFGFTAPFGIGVFLEIGHSLNPWLGAAVGALGALLADLVIFHVMRFEFFHEEIHKLRTTRIVTWAHRKLHHESVPEKVREYLVWCFAGLVIASPLPDEFGVILVSSMTNINERAFAVLSFFMNMLGILVFIAGSKLIAG